jgi:hypothetical protein
MLSRKYMLFLCRLTLVFLEILVWDAFRIKSPRVKLLRGSLRELIQFFGFRYGDYKDFAQSLLYEMSVTELLAVKDWMEVQVF